MLSRWCMHLARFSRRRELRRQGVLHEISTSRESGLVRGNIPGIVVLGLPQTVLRYSVAGVCGTMVVLADGGLILGQGSAVVVLALIHEAFVFISKSLIPSYIA